MFRGPFLIVVVADIGDIDPGVRHLIDGPIAPSHPLIRIGIVGALAVVLSCHAFTWMIVPFGNTGAASSA